jgi:hypothetical protein
VLGYAQRSLVVPGERVAEVRPLRIMRRRS